MVGRIVINPPRRAGYIFHIITIIVLIASAGLFINQAVQSSLGPVFLFFLLGALFIATPLPLMFYRLYGLYRSSYILEREGLRLMWGLREEDIPMTEIDWVRLDTTLDSPLELPRIRWPGGLLGVRRHRDMGEVEFLAARRNRLVLIGTKKKVYAISPQDQKAFIQAFRHQIELGPLKPIAARSVYPSFLLAEVWKSRLTRSLLLAGFGLNLSLLIWVALVVPDRENISLGFAPNGALLPPVRGVQLLLLPIVSVFFFLANFVEAVYFFRRDGKHPLMYLMWGGSVATASLFLSAVYIILRAS
jgi:hypothetical protein